MAAATISDVINYGDNAARGPVYNKSIAALASGTYTLVLPANPSRKFLLIKPGNNHIHVHFLTPGAAANTIADTNSFTVASGNSDAPLRFETFVPTNAVYIKANTGATDITIFEN